MLKFMFGMLSKFLFGKRLSKELSRFFGTKDLSFPIQSRAFSAVDLPNIQLAIEALAKEAGATIKSQGYSAEMAMLGNKLGTLTTGITTVGPVQYRYVEIGESKRLRCLVNGLHLIALPGGKAVIHVLFSEMQSSYELEVMTQDEQFGSEILEEIFKCWARENVYRGKIISLEATPEGRSHRECCSIVFCSLPTVRREDIILPQSVLETIERNTISFLHHSEALRRSGRSVKRGILLHGRPGTGKTYTAKWLSRSMEGLTVILLSGEQLWNVKYACWLAAALAPSLVIMEDVDLIASRRDTERHPQYEMTLHQLLNEMDGMRSDAAVIFLLTTNRPDIIEPAIAARPGRIDQAIEYPMPDAECRRRLIELYGRGLKLQLDDMESLIARTDGASPAFIQELLRKAALFAAEKNLTDDGTLVVRDAQCDAALRELLFGGGGLTRDLLGFTVDHTAQSNPCA